MTSTLLYRLSTVLLGGMVMGQGIPVTDPLVTAKCGSCHTRDEQGIMQRISWLRTTPEAWQDTVKRMIVVNGVSLTQAEARSVVKYLSTNHGLAPEEARPVLYDAERRTREETGFPESLSGACTKCHAFARALSWRRSAEEWKLFADSHMERYRYKVPNDAVVAYLAKAAPLHTPEWDARNARTRASSLTGRWLVTALLQGHGEYYGEMQVDPAGDDEFTTRATLMSVRDGSTIQRSGRSAVYGGYAWRGRSKGGDTPGTAPDDPSIEAREVMWIAPDQLTAEGRWFWGQYQEFGFDVKLQRTTSDPTLVTVDRSSLKAGSEANRVRVIGINLPAEPKSSDLDFGPGVNVSGIVSHSSNEVIVEVDVASGAALGKHDVTFRGSPLPGGIAIYDRVDYVKVTPESALATFGDPAHPRGYEQFEATGYQRGADGKLHTDDDVELGPVEVTWSLEVFYAAEGSSSDYVGRMSATGLFVPASASPNTNVDTWVVATAKNEKDKDGKPLVGKAYLVVTVPMYTLNGRRYVRDLNRWIDDGPAAGTQ